MLTKKRSFVNVSLGSLFAFASFGSLEAAKLSEVIDNATIQGFAFSRVNSLHGIDGIGTRYQFRFKPTITTGEVNGVSASAGLFFSKGSAMPDGSTEENDIGGSRGQTISGSTDRFNVGDFYVTYNTAEIFGSKTTIRLGQKSPGTPFNDNNLDRAIGVFIENKDIDALNLGFQWWDAWMADDIYISSPSCNDNKCVNSSGVGIGNNMVMVYAKSSDAFAKDTGLSYNLWLGHINKWVSAMIFADVAYKLNISNNQTITFTAQTAFTSIDKKNVFIYSGSSSSPNYLRYIGNAQRYQDVFANNRGVYNLRVDYKYDFAESSGDSKQKSSDFFTASAGIAGGYGDGFGALLNYAGAIKVGGHIWNSSSGADANGFGITGVGSFKNSHLFTFYGRAGIGYKNAGVALDLAYVNASHFYLLKAGTKRINGNGHNLNSSTSDFLYGSNNAVIPVDIIDIGLSATYKFTSNINALVAYGYMLGTQDFGRFRFQVNYVF